MCTKFCFLDKGIYYTTKIVDKKYNTYYNKLVQNLIKGSLAQLVEQQTLNQ